jgi:hypothetical protein
MQAQTQSALLVLHVFLCVYLVELGEEGGGGHLDSVNGHRVTLLKVNLNDGGLVGSLSRDRTPYE